MALRVTSPYLSYGLIVDLPLVHQGDYCCIHRIPALLAAPDIQVSTNLIVKVFPVNSTPQIRSAFKDMLAFLSNQLQVAPAAYNHKHITNFSIDDVEENTASGLEPALALVRPWYQEDILQYGNRNPGFSNITLLIQAAKALEHLHHYNVVHGHIHPGNIFITGQGHATLADPSVHTIARRFIVHPSRRVPPQISSVYQAPEFLWPGTDAFIEPEKPSDVYAFASTILAVLTGYPPFHGSLVPTTEHAVAVIMLNGHLYTPKPDRNIIGDTLWALLQQCWHRDPTARPSIGDVVTALEDIELYRW